MWVAFVAMKQTLFSGFCSGGCRPFGWPSLFGRYEEMRIMLIAGIVIGMTGDASVRATAQPPRMFVGMKGEILKRITLFLIPLIDLNLDFR